MTNIENNILDKLISKTTQAAEQLLNNDDLEVKLAENITEEDQKKANVISLEKLMSITEKLNNMHTKRINAKLKQEKLATIKESQSISNFAAGNFHDLSIEEKQLILFKDQDFFKIMHNFPKQAIAEKYFAEALACINDENAYKKVIHKMIAAEKLTLEYLGEVGIIKKLSEEEINAKFSNRYHEIDQLIRKFHDQELMKNEELTTNEDLTNKAAQ